MRQLAGNKTVMIAALLVVLTYVAYHGVLGCGFVNYDDDKFITRNPSLQGGLPIAGIKWAFTTIYKSNWYPLTWLSYMVDKGLYGLNPMGFHLTNLLFHLANVVLLLILLNRMTGSFWKSAFVAGLFALHPLHVESVAWIAERKDVLSTFFFLLTLGAYTLYCERPGIKRYVPVVILYALGLMAKPMLVTLPLVLLLLDYWPLKRSRRWSRLIFEKTPLFAMSAASSVVTYIAQAKGGAVGRLDVYTPAARVANAFTAYTAYLWKMIWPAKLAVLYPHPGDSLPMWKAVASAALLIAITVLVLTRKRPYLTVGWLWFLGTLVPVIGLVQVGGQAIADRYTYIPLIGVFIMISWGIPGMLRSSGKSRLVLAVAACLILLVLGIATMHQVGYWEDSIALFEHTLACTSGNYFAHDSLGSALLFAERYVEAEIEEREALKYYPGFARARYNLGLALQDQGRYVEAIKEYQEAIRLQPDLGLAHYNLAITLYFVGDYNASWKEVHVARKYETPMNSEFLQALAEKMPEPDG